MDKRALVTQLTDRLRTAAGIARRASEDAAQEARDGASPAERREDSRVALENAGLAKGQARRAEQVLQGLAALNRFNPGPFPANARVGLGAVVEVEDEEGGRTFFLAPAGAGEELAGPDGDGIICVVTPVSPVGRAVLGHRAGESVGLTVAGEARELTITFVG